MKDINTRVRTSALLNQPIALPEDHSEDLLFYDNLRHLHYVIDILKTRHIAGVRTYPDHLEIYTLNGRRRVRLTPEIRSYNRYRR